MADVKQEGQEKTGALDGGVNLKKGENVFELFDQGTQVYQLVLGKITDDGQYALIITNPGFDVYDSIEV